MNLFTLLLLVNIGIALCVAAISFRNRQIKSSIYLAILSLTVAFWSIAFLFFNLQTFYISKPSLIALIYFCDTACGSTLLAFSLTYSNRAEWLRRETILLLGIEPIIGQLLFSFKNTRELFFLSKTVSDHLSLTSGIWSEINTVYIYSLEIACLLFLTDLFTKKPRNLFFQSGILLAAVFFPFLFRTLELVGEMLPASTDLSLIGYSLAVIGLAIGLYRTNAVETEPITSDTIIQAMNDGWMVLDLNNNIIDVNPAAEKIVGLSRQNMYGKPIRTLLPDWPNISASVGEGKELEMRRSVRALGSWRYLNTRLSILRNRLGQPFAQLIIWRDITERKMAEEARQRARDEMFVILNAISNAASHSIKLDDFLSESVYQLIYPFQSQLIALFLLEDLDNLKQAGNLQLSAHFGLTPDSQNLLDTDATLSTLFEIIGTAKQPLTIDNADTDPRVPIAFQQTTKVAIFPLISQTGEHGRTLGMMIIGRKNAPSYSADELIRLSTIAEQIANLVDSDRRRQLAIALSEREKLMRDLHDSVSQKLYGLVTLTEAAQAAIEAGSNVIPYQVLAKIGDNARQAVKEMRLFLYQMQPVDLEKGDLISALHHRLGAVEGRADIQARFLPDEGIHISKEKEIALYFIAQEALNNILKHAHANLVLVRLKQTKKNIILEVTDNGHGFDLKKADHNGMGIQNMKARTAQINGKLRINSKPGAGASIRVVVSRDHKTIHSKKR